MWVLQGGNVAKNNLTIMMEILHSWLKKPMKFLGMQCGYCGATMLQNVV
jgi:hypothetical protein